jgi:hypothetical protein
LRTDAPADSGGVNETVYLFALSSPDLLQRILTPPEAAQVQLPVRFMTLAPPLRAPATPLRASAPAPALPPVAARNVSAA